MESYCVEVDGDDLVFSAAHLVTLAGDVCERLHGHDFRVTVKVFGPLAGNGFVVDFLVLRDVVRKILDEWDHRILLAEGRGSIRVEATAERVEATHGARRWVFPRDDCALLPIPATTTEHLAGHLARRVAHELRAVAGARPTRVIVELGEARGRSASCHYRPE
ncbi:MAG: 6-pyruvoyl tetrahydropterin synthase family protein [Pirellulales bacterium]|nr:6-pyruvoyl tetrahydropterin synthase family protein [Pirellulales bacterium]